MTSLTKAFERVLGRADLGNMRAVEILQLVAEGKRHSKAEKRAIRPKVRSESVSDEEFEGYLDEAALLDLKIETQSNDRDYDRPRGTMPVSMLKGARPTSLRPVRVNRKSFTQTR